MSYRYETHCHSAQCSRCAHSSSQELVRAYHKAGYAGLVLTDHFIFGNTAVDRNLPWEAQMRCYHNAYLDARAEADGLDFDVIFGIEHACGDGREFLCYGIDLDFLLANPDIPLLTLERFVKRVRDYGGLVIQAHPYRYWGPEVPLRADLIDGIEVYNASNHPESNVHALSKVQQDFILTSGGDVHWAGDTLVGAAGIVLPHRIHDEKELVSALKQREHEYVINHKILQEIHIADIL